MIELPSPLRAVIFQSIVERLWLQLNLVMYSTRDFIYAVMWNAFDMYLILYGILNKEKKSWSYYLWNVFLMIFWLMKDLIVKTYYTCTHRYMSPSTYLYSTHLYPVDRDMCLFSLILIQAYYICDTSTFMNINCVLFRYRK